MLRLCFLAFALAYFSIHSSLAAESQTIRLDVINWPKLQSWMHTDVAVAWQQGYKGEGVTITAVDDWRGYRLLGKLDTESKWARHGEWTLKQASMIAPGAWVRTHDFNSGQSVRLNNGLNVLNLSYGLYAKSGYSTSQIAWTPQEQSIISYANSGNAVISKAAGNDASPIASATASGKVDYLNLALKGTPSTIYVGALSQNGTTASPATLASYSNRPGHDWELQRKFVVVGVDGNKTGLYGTSYAAPIVSGYAAIIGSKFTKSTPAQISNQLLSTARTDTIKDYSPAMHGRGEASLARALAPLSIQ